MFWLMHGGKRCILLTFNYCSALSHAFEICAERFKYNKTTIPIQTWGILKKSPNLLMLFAVFSEARSKELYLIMTGDQIFTF